MTRGQTDHCAAEVLAGVLLVVPVGGEEVLSEVQNCKASGGCDRDEKMGGTMAKVMMKLFLTSISAAP